MDNLERQTLIRLQEIGMRHSNKSLFSGIDLDVCKGDFLAITGPNGGGKTTLLRIMLRLLSPTSGSVLYLDKEGMPGATLRIGYLPQKSTIDSRFPISVRHVIASGLGGHMVSGLDKLTKNRMVDDMIARVELDSHAESPIGEISGGQLQRALLGRALVANPEIVVLDEPLSYLDRHFERRLYSILESISPSTTIVLVSHEMTQISAMASRHVIIDHGLEECHCASHAVHYDCRS